MKTWSGVDLAGFILSLFGISCVLFSNSSWLTNIVFIFSSLVLMHGLYKARFESVQYREMLCHFQGVLSASGEGWIAWNEDNEYIGSSKKFKELFNLEKYDVLRVADILDSLSSDCADDLAFYLNKLLKSGEEFKIIVQSKGNKNIEIKGARKIISKIESIVLWGNDITETSSEFINIKNTADKTTSLLDNVMEILNTIPVPVWKRDEDLHITYCNSAYASILDKSINEIVNNNIPLVSGNLFGQGHSLAENAKKCNKSQTIVQSITVAGNKKQFALHECIKPEGDFIGFALDITNSEKLASQLDKTIASTCDVLNELSSSIAIYDNNMRLIFFNKSFQCTMKLEAGWLHARPTFSEVMDELRNNRRLPEVADFQAFKKDQIALFNSIVEPVQSLLYLPNGRCLRQLITPYSCGGLVFIYEDITNSLSLQQKNDTLQAVQKETIDHLYEGIIVCGSDNRIKIMNTSLANIWGFDIEKTKEIHLSELLNLIETQLNYEGDWNIFRGYVISNLTDRMAKTGHLIRKDGSIILFAYVPLPDGSHMYSMMDITDKYNVESAIIEKNQALDAAHNLEKEFIESVSIEIKEPLSILLGAAELLMHEYYGKLNEKQKEYCGFIVNSSNQLQQLMNNVIDMVLIDKDASQLNVDKFVVTEVIEEILSNLKLRIQEKNLEIITNYCDMPLFYGDRVRIKQAMFSIVLNAIQLAPNDSIIEIITRYDDDNIKIITKDYGIRGDTQESQEKKLTTFTRLGDSNQNNLVGHGISVSLAKTLIEKHGGKIKIISDIKGTSVMCTLPNHHIEKNTVDFEKRDLREANEAVNL